MVAVKTRKKKNQPTDSVEEIDYTGWKFRLNDREVSKEEHDTAVAEHIAWLEDQANKLAEELLPEKKTRKKR
jgi:hypothetical protein